MCPPSQDCLQIFFQLLIIGLTNGSAIALNAIGVTLVFSVIRTINFAYGDIFALTTVLVGTIISRLQLDTETNSLALISGLFIALGAAMLVASALNVAVERIAFRPFRSTSRLAPLIATLGISFILYQAALIWRRFEPSFHPGEHRSVPGLPEIPKGGFGEVLPQTDLFQIFGIQTNITFLFKDFLLLLIAIIFAGLVSWLLYRTKIGLSLRAVAQNPELAQYCGLDRNKIIRRAFMIGGALSGAAAFIFTIYYTHPFGQHGLQSGLIAFAAAILGGIGRPWGAFVSGLFLGVIAAFSDYFLAAQWTPALVQVLLIALLVLRPTGVESEKENNDLLSVAPRDMITRIPRDLKTRRNVWLAAGAMVLAILFPL
ncbi:MAG: branched-chain amino acid ABC transporter permease, partial [Chloroflexi bacterium]|nr:branched-chain amino acid ABC transporter permease [Chloroflexota bacterium]